MTRRAAVRAALAASAVAALAPAARPAGAGITVRYPSGEVPDAATLAAALQSPDVGTVVFARGTNLFTGSLTVFRREGLTLAGDTSRAADTTIESSSSVAVLLEECTGVTFRNLTIRSTAANGEAVRMQSVRSSSVEGFVRDVTARNCRFEGFVGIRATVRAQDLDVAGCRFDVTRAGGAGILWEDGPGLFVTRSRFTVSASAAATGAIVVRGAFVAESEGDRARRVILTRNRVDGDFVTAFDLSDVVDTRIRGNRVTFPSALYDPDGGRAGFIVRRASAAAQTEDWEVRSNRVRNAHTAVWVLNAGDGVVASNDLRRSGSAAADTRFGDTGCAVRVGLFGPVCRVTITGNDLRQLRSAAGEPAVVVAPPDVGGLCAARAEGNRVDGSRSVFPGGPKR